MKHPSTRHVGLDSQCLSYLLDGIAGISEPTDALAEEKKALLRTWFVSVRESRIDAELRDEDC